MNAFLARMLFRIHERLLGRKTFGILSELEASQWWPRERIEDLQLRRLQQLVAVAYEHTPYWRSVMDAHGIRPGNILSLKDLRRFPLSTKQTIRDRREEMVWKDEGSRVQIARTSGSTNAALDFYTSSSREAHITAARMRGHKWMGVDPGDREMYFWAAPVELKAQDRVKQIRDFLRNDGFTDALDITPQAVARNLEIWKRWRPKCIFGYVSSFTLMARMAAEVRLDLTVLRDRGLRAIVTTSEILGENRRIIEDAFGVPAYDSYGIRETGLIGHECQYQTMHTNDEQLILEVLDRQTLQPTDGEGELVATALISRVMPVIRYRTGDVVTLSNRPCPCGRTLASGRVSGGRLLEFIVTTEGRWVSAVAFIYVCRKVKEVLQVQARQEQLGEVRVLVVPDKDFPPDGVDRVREAVRERMGGKDEIKVELVAEIPASPSGKQKLVVGKVAERLLAEGGGLALRAAGGG